ncbi:MAG: hypothetical protein VW644_09800 [Alphaproteobacteria bacterium]
MKIELKEIAIRTLADGFADNAEQGVVATVIAIVRGYVLRRAFNRIHRLHA